MKYLWFSLILVLTGIGLVGVGIGFSIMYTWRPYSFSGLQPFIFFCFCVSFIFIILGCTIAIICFFNKDK